MANPTTNYGFVLPTSSDLVTDLPADFEVALQGVDTRLKALQPGTTLGDLAYSSATANTNTRLGIGSNGQVLSVSGGVPAWTTSPAAGKVLQIVQATTTTTATTSSTSWADTNLSATITPSAATSKVLILTNQSIKLSASTNNANGGFRLLRDSTYIFGTVQASAPDNVLYQATGATVIEVDVQWNFVYLDSPNTTSAVTYKTQQAEATTASNNTVISQQDNFPSSMILMEIGA
jgi:hypothetical protein